MNSKLRLVQERLRRRLVSLIVFSLLGALPVLGQSLIHKTSKTYSNQDATVVASGEVRPIRYVRLTSDVDGEVKEIYVSPGERIKKGQALVLVEEHSRQQKQVKQYSPLSGVVAEISTQLGDRVSVGRKSKPLMMIADLATINVEIAVDESEIDLVRVGQLARIIVDAFHETEILGVVSGKRPLPLRPQVNAGEKKSRSRHVTREFIVLIALNEMPAEIRNRLLPGMSATAWISPVGRK